jgi:nucleoside-diphosphate-sugar epimerase
VTDAVSAVINLLGAKNEVFNLGSGIDFSINEFAQQICLAYDYDFGKVQHDLSKYVGVPAKKLDPNFTTTTMGRELSNISLEDGIREAIEYFVSNYEQTRIHQ